LISKREKETSMQFGKYLRLCREQTNMTQEELIQNLYNFDIEKFKGLNSSTLSKWERGVTQPSSSKKVTIIKFFQNFTGMALPYLNTYTTDNIQEYISNIGVKNIFGKNRKYILEFPEETMNLDDMKICSVHEIKRKKTLLDINYTIHKEYNPAYTRVSLEQFNEWSSKPNNLFMVAEYKNVAMALLFMLRLKPYIFDKLLNFEMKKSDITADDFATFEEEGDNYILSFFALNEKSATLLMIRYYSYLIANQDNTHEVGTINTMPESQTNIRNMNFEVHKRKTLKDGTVIKSYKQTLENIIIHESSLNIIFPNNKDKKPPRKE